MISKRVLSAGLALGLAWSGCGANDTADLEAPRGGGPSAGTGGTRDGTPSANGGDDDGEAGADGEPVAGNGGSTDEPRGGAAGSSAASAGGAVSSPVESEDAVPSAGCDADPEFESGRVEIEVGGVVRSFILDVPAGYDPSQAYPLVFGFHGRDFTAAEFRGQGYGNLPSVAADEAILVHPDAVAAVGAWELDSQQDVAFFDAMLETLTRGLCVDEARVFATGHSSGGYFTNLLGCQRGDVLRAIAPVAGGGPFGPNESEPSCQRPVSVWIAHSEDDETVPFVNGEGSLEYWLDSDGCDASSVEAVEPDPCVAYDGCGDGLAVRWCAYAGGHDWPDFAARGIWDFFQSF